jgi:hypothetical protein
MGEGDVRVSGTDAACVFRECPVPDAEEPVLDAPVGAGEHQQRESVEEFLGDGCDGVDDLPGAGGPRLAQPLDAHDADSAWPDGVEAGGDRADGGRPCLDASMAAVDMARAAHVGRVDGDVSLPGAAGEPRGGNHRRSGGRSRLAGLTGCPSRTGSSARRARGWRGRPSPP